MVYSTPSKKRGLDGNLKTDWGGCFDERDYSRGAIKRIKVTNFMTYKDATVYPGPRLNLVLGPNGSGKSSIVCAVGLGLCANSKKLGRSDQVKNFVRTGCDSGSVEIVISGGPNEPDYIISRHLHRDNNSSTFRINGNHKTQKDVEALNKKLTIQLDNLCQFLPQEKVVEFSKMTPQELLMSTESAIGDGRLRAMHVQLQEGGSKLAALHNEQGKMARQLEDRVSRRDGMQHDVEKIREHDKLVTEAARFGARAAQLRQAEAQEAYAQKKAAHEEKAKEVAAVEKELAAAKRPTERMTKDIADCKRQAGEVGKQVGKLQATYEKLADTVESAVDKAQEVQRQIDSCDKDEAARQKKLATERQVHAATLAEEAALPAQPPGYDAAQDKALKEERKACQAQLTAATARKTELRRDNARLVADRRRAVQQKARLEGIAEHRLQKLAGYQGNGYLEFVRHVRRMHQEKKFQGRVHGPVLCDVKMREGVPAHAAEAVEAAIAHRIKSAFVVEHVDDQRLIEQESRRHNVQGINVLQFRGTAAAPIQHQFGAQPDGTLGTLDACFDAPDIVKHALCDHSGVNVAYLIEGDAAAARAVCDSTGARLVFAPGERHAQHVSAFDRSKVSMQSGFVQKANLLALTVDAGALAEVDEKIAEIDRDLASCEGKLAEADADEQQAAAQRQQIDEQLEHLKELMKKHAAKKHHVTLKLQRVEATIAKLDKEAPLVKKPALQAQAKKQRESTLSAAVEMTGELLPQMRALAVQRTGLQLREAQLKDAKVALEAEIEAKHANVLALKQEAAATKHEAETAKAELDGKKRDAADALKELSAADKEALDELPDDAEACDEEAAERRGRAQRMAVGDRGVLERYTNLVKACEKAAAEKEAKDAEVATLQGELAEAKEQWLPELKTKIDAISAKFSANFARIGSVGAVSLHEAGDAYDQYAIQIKVKFRDEGDLEVLDRAVHSGGEKSVSTIMFLLSLQKITATPFRVVDEINQGMDATNERKVFQAMVDAATERNTAQCLLMTPKLLPQLDYSEHVNVLGIVNGAYVGTVARELKPSAQLETLLGTHVPVAEPAEAVDIL